MKGGSGTSNLQVSTWPPESSGRIVNKQIGTFNDGRLCYLMQTSKDRGLTPDNHGQRQPKSEEGAQKPGVKEQKEAADQQIESPGEPAGGE